MYEKVASSLDWNWSDYARFLTCTRRPGLTGEVVKISSGCNSLRFTLFECLADQTGDLDHPVYSLYTLEAELDLGASILLSYGGYYKQAGICLRSFLELAFLSIYYADHRKEYSRWKIGEAKSPPFHARDASVLEYIFKETKLNDHQELKKEASSLYLELNQFVHTGGIDKLDLWRGRDNVPRFLPHSFQLWLSYLKRIHIVTALSFLILYYDAIGHYLQRDKSGMLKEIFTSIGKKSLQQVDIGHKPMG